MQQRINLIAQQAEAFKADADKSLLGNKAAGVRARHAALTLINELKQFRKESLAASASKS